jgi:hypothetical protein
MRIFAMTAGRDARRKVRAKGSRGKFTTGLAGSFAFWPSPPHVPARGMTFTGTVHLCRLSRWRIRYRSCRSCRRLLVSSRRCRRNSCSPVSNCIGHPRKSAFRCTIRRSCRSCLCPFASWRTRQRFHRMSGPWCTGRSMYHDCSRAWRPNRPYRTLRSQYGSSAGRCIAIRRACRDWGTACSRAHNCTFR